MNSISFSLTLDLLCIRIESIFPLNSLWLHYLLRDFTIFLLSEFTTCFDRDFILNIVSLSRIYYKFAFLSANKLWIHFEYFIFFCFANSPYIKKDFREIDLNQLSQLSNALEFTILFANVIEFNIFVANSLKIRFLFGKFTFYFAYSIWIGFFCQKTINSLFVSRIIFEVSIFLRIYYKFTIFYESTLSSLSFTLWIHYFKKSLWIQYLFR